MKKLCLILASVVFGLAVAHEVDAENKLKPGEVFGLRLTVVKVGGDVNLVIHPGQCRDAEDRADIDLPLGETRVVDPTRSGLGGLDAGSVQPRTSYALYLVRAGNNVGGVLSLSFDPMGQNPPQFPPGNRLAFRRIGAVATDANGRIIPFRQTGNREERQYRYLATNQQLAVLVNGTAEVFTNFDLAPFYNLHAEVALLLVVPGNGVPVTVAPTHSEGGPTLTIEGPTSYGFSADLSTTTLGQYRNEGSGGNTRIAVLGFSETL